MTRLTHNHLIAFTLLALLALLAFYPTFASGFVCDDLLIVVHNPRIRSLGNFGTILTTSYWGDLDRRVSLYRPLTILSFAVDYFVAGFTVRGSLNPVVYHATNLLVHILCSIAVYVVMRRYFVRPGTALVAAMLFAVHPVHSDVVYAAVNRSDSLAALFFLIAFIFYVEWRRTAEERPGDWRLLASSASFFIALGFKEMAVSLPVVLFFLDVLVLQKSVKAGARALLPGKEGVHVSLAGGFHPVCGGTMGGSAVALTFPPQPSPQAGREQEEQRSDVMVTFERDVRPKAGANAFISQAMRRYGYFAAVILLHVLLRLILIGRLGSGLRVFVDTPVLTRVLTMSVVVADYVGALFFPVFLTADYPYNQWSATYHHSFADVRVLSSLLILAAVGVIGILLAKQRCRAALFWLLFFAVSLLPVLNIVPVSIVKGDRLLYLPSVGFCYLAAVSLERLWARARPATAVAFVGVAVVFMCLSQGHGMSHRSGAHFAEYLCIVHPRFPFAHYLRGKVFAERGERDREIACYTAALNLMPDYKNALHSRGIALYGLCDLVGAEADFRRLIELPPVNPRVYINLGCMLAEQGRLHEAIAQYSAALDTVNKEVETYMDHVAERAGYSAQGSKVDQFRSALLAMADESTISNPVMPRDYADFLSARGRAYFRLAECQRAFDDLAGSLALFPPDLGSVTGATEYVAMLGIVAECNLKLNRLEEAAQDLNYLADWKCKLKRFGEAALDFKRLAELLPAQAAAHLVREVECWLEANELEKAREAAKGVRAAGGEVPEEVRKRLGE